MVTNWVDRRSSILLLFLRCQQTEEEEEEEEVVVVVVVATVMVGKPWRARRRRIRRIRRRGNQWNLSIGKADIGFCKRGSALWKNVLLSEDGGLFFCETPCKERPFGSFAIPPI
ncbi:hypothetical protein M0802_010347 [Mischocyttarus mexicanus]|nr:hypothetical protein M0802_010347 [Mischocyttarus mexicanus]